MAGDGVLVSIFIRTFGAFIATSSQTEREREGGVGRGKKRKG